MGRRGKVLRVRKHIMEDPNIPEDKRMRVLEYDAYLQWAGARQRRTKKRPPSFERYLRLKAKAMDA